MTKIRTGQAPAPLTRAQFRERFHGRFYDPAFGAERDAIDRLRSHCLGRRAGRSQGARHAARRPWLCGPQLRDLGAVAGDPQAPEGGAKALERQRGAVAGAADLRQRPQRRHLPGRGLEDLAPDRDGAACRRARGHAGRCAGPEPGHVGIRPQHPPVQGLRVQRDAAVPLALHAATPTMRWTRPTTGWPRSTSAGSPRTP